MQYLKSYCLAVSMCFAAPFVVAGCSEAPEQRPSESTGTLSAALAATGSDGANYEFPAGTYLIMTNSSWSQGFPLDGPSTIFTQQLPVGSYQLSLSFPSFTPTFVRTEGSSTSVVDAVWTDSSPISVDIIDDTTTPVVLHFHVEGLGDLVFDTGKLQVTLDVIEEDVSEAGMIKEEGPINLFGDYYADPMAAYATELHVDLNVDTWQALWMSATSDWAQLGVAAVCKNVSMAALGYSSSAVGNRLLELVGGSAQVCIYDGGTTDTLVLTLWNNAPAPFEQQWFLPDASYNFNLYIQGEVGDVYDGETLQQSLLTEPLPATNGYFTHYIYDSSNTLVTSIYGNFSGTFQLLP